MSQRKKFTSSFNFSLSFHVYLDLGNILVFLVKQLTTFSLMQYLKALSAARRKESRPFFLLKSLIFKKTNFPFRCYLGFFRIHYRILQILFEFQSPVKHGPSKAQKSPLLTMPTLVIAKEDLKNCFFWKQVKYIPQRKHLPYLLCTQKPPPWLLVLLVYLLNNFKICC